MSKTTYTIVMPGLRAACDERASSLPAQLVAWLARSQQRCVVSSFYDVLLDLFCYPQETYHLANLRAHYDGLDSNAHWLCADPIHLAVDVAHVYSLGNAYLHVSTDELKRYVKAINRYLPSGFELVAPHPLRWYLKLNRPWDIHCHYPDMILAKTVLDKLPQGLDAAHAVSLFNELQMLLHHHPDNIKRRHQAKPTVDALWLWGAGCELPARYPQTWDFIVSDDALVLALAKKNHIQIASSLDAARGNVLFVDRQFHYQDVLDQCYQHFPLSQCRALNKLFVGDGLLYERKKIWQRLWSK